MFKRVLTAIGCLVLISALSCGTATIATTKLSKELNTIIATKLPKEIVSVGIWLAVSDPLINITDKQQRLEAYQEYYSNAEAPIIAFIEKQGYKATYASILSPLVFADLPKSLILEISARRDVAGIDYGGTVYTPIS